jgi:hypothetical protein
MDGVVSFLFSQWRDRQWFRGVKMRNSPPAPLVEKNKKGNKPGLESGILTRLRLRQEKVEVRERVKKTDMFIWHY